jgi:GLPGLI family protein
MKRFIFSGAALTLLAFTARAQKPDTARVLVHYKFSHVQDTTDRAHPNTENMVLLVGKSASVYKSYDGMMSDAQFRAAYVKATNSGPDGRVMVDRSGAGLRPQYFQYSNTQRFITKDYIMVDEYLIDGPMPAIDWKIGSDTATFGGLHCQKATGHFKGRDYLVWFCPDLPVHVGPWKLNGLPGVIVDARDVKNEVIFQFDGAEKAAFTEMKPITGPGVAEKDVPPILRGLDDNPNIILPPARAIKATQKEYDKLKTGMQRNPGALSQGVAAADGAGAREGDHVIKSIADHVQHHNNNPLELPERK